GWRPRTVRTRRCGSRRRNARNNPEPTRPARTAWGRAPPPSSPRVPRGSMRRGGRIRRPTPPARGRGDMRHLLLEYYLLALSSWGPFNVHPCNVPPTPRINIAEENYYVTQSFISSTIILCNNLCMKKHEPGQRRQGAAFLLAQVG